MHQNEAGLIGVNVIWSLFIVRYTVEDKLQALHVTQMGSSEAGKPRSLKSREGVSSSLAAL